MFENDMHALEDTIKNLSKRITQEHKEVHNVLNNMIAIVKSKPWRGKRQSILRLENILEQDPRHLNALADIEYLCRSLHRATEADRYKEVLDVIMNGDKTEDRRSKALCLMEQGYAILYDVDANVEHITKDRLSESYRMLLSEHRKSTGTRCNYIQLCIYHNKEALLNLQRSIEVERENQFRFRRQRSLDQIKQSKTLCELSFIWSYYEGVALNRKYDSIKDMCQEDGINRDYEKKYVTLEAAEIFWKIIIDRKFEVQNCLIYKSRSIALLGHIILKRYYCFHNINMHRFANLPRFRYYITYPLSALEEAYNMNTNDTFILNRFGRALMISSCKSMDQNIKTSLLHRAENLLSKSIQQDPFNWFAYTTRMSVRRQLALEYIYFDNDRAQQLLIKAASDGYQIFCSKGTSKSLCEAVDICQHLAKFPAIRTYGCEHVAINQKCHLLDALDYLNYGIKQSGPTNFYLVYRMGAVLYDLNELKPAIDWMKRALSLSHTGNSMSLNFTCLYMLKKHSIDVANDSNIQYLIRDFIYTLGKGQQKFGNILSVCRFLLRNSKDHFIALLGDTIRFSFLLNRSRVSLLTECIQTCAELISINKGKSNALQTYLEQLSQIQFVDEIEPNFEDEFESMSLMPKVLDISQLPHEFKYDFFVSYSHKDSDWVMTRLVPDLECSLLLDDVPLKGCIANRDFQPGKFIFENIIDCIQDSSKVILVLTKHFVESYWCQFEANQALLELMEPKKKKKCIIPLLLAVDENEIPSKLKDITYADFTSDEDYMDEIVKLKKVLSPG
ncbi:TLR2 [Mytilus coruscus]|uniref:TLR2 n=1 Tax=Mytilus coruscus TaxID=42192 RepID=A0A6J8ACW5_MYTCO|nr:TLR2 [Mytilus coruscus]